MNMKLRSEFDAIQVRCGAIWVNMIAKVIQHELCFVYRQESGKKLTPLYGPGYTGLYNLGNRQAVCISVFDL